MKREFRCGQCRHLLFEHSVKMPAFKQVQTWGCSRMECDCWRYEGPELAMTARTQRLFEETADGK